MNLSASSSLELTVRTRSHTRAAATRLTGVPMSGIPSEKAERPETCWQELATCLSRSSSHSRVDLARPDARHSLPHTLKYAEAQ